MKLKLTGTSFRGFTENFMEIDQTTNLDKKSVSMSDLRNVSQNTGSSNFFSKFTATTKSQENLSVVSTFVFNRSSANI